MTGPTCDVCEKVAQLGQAWCVRAGVGLKHLSGDVKKMMSKVLAIDQNHYPEMLGHTVIINAPSVFKMLFGFIKPMLDARTQGKIEVLNPKP